ncbi:MAG: glycerophosphodiester phosphodiesterase [Abyssibacter sp.]|uniref:glycerophosphodiester phosphodiesterase n=1 Tax=Abyssibacter sp. TaxID=2320200 RepID=UPI00321B1429
MDDLLMRSVDAMMAVLPRRRPPASRLHAARIISHRGERPRPDIRENSFAAFDPLVNSGVWGLEFDIRFTADGVPVVYHDPDLQRVHGRSERLDRLSAAELAALAPDIPTAAQFVARYGARFHLMIEVKQEVYRDQPAYCGALMDALGALEPARDFHLMSLHPTMLDRYATVPESAKISIARFNVANISDHVLARGQAGIGAHYALITSRRARRHLSAGQELALGFPQSRYSLMREINRGANWLFSNQALAMQHTLDHLRKAASAY